MLAPPSSPPASPSSPSSPSPPSSPPSSFFLSSSSSSALVAPRPFSSNVAIVGTIPSLNIRDVCFVVPSAKGVNVVNTLTGNPGLSNARHALFSPPGPCPSNDITFQNSFTRPGSISSPFSSKNVFSCTNPYLFSIPGILYEKLNTDSLKSSYPPDLTNSGLLNISLKSLKTPSAADLSLFSLSMRFLRATSRDLRNV